ncbi:exodeoxyribonuclease VII large subunit [Mechercharimyces sp. CAU 1602]|uniref:exodeoxyribonuclease VII large subunit n=1 Tax=Mechercharimyces sp. CAU 1602 TaxID=2973933 RepID=UPI002162F5C9|nr:exodeoxyribonuclease VII large subunit [Mechercharimyces sp. CAU 1602]MCS1350786.1 exodeoxyribonuclease VII large subunit [Mechercharimyces sp. CAU 1602]
MSDDERREPKIDMLTEERQTFSVSELMQYMRDHLEKDGVLSRIWVQAEISNFRHHERGHMYFTLKDHTTQIKAVMFHGNNRRLRFRPKDGDQVLVRGYISVYERGGTVQLYVQYMQPDGIGDLYLAFQRLKEQLQAEGLFADELKKPLPHLPRRVGVVTAAGGAAIRDIVSTMQRRAPMVPLLIRSVPVQGEGAAEEIATAIDELGTRSDLDVLIVGRGGGSLEELWAFNREEVARSIVRSPLPIVSAVGHESDVTIADFVADVRAATPTAAAELVVPSLTEVQEQLISQQKRLWYALQQRIKQEGKRQEWLSNRLWQTSPTVRLKQWEQRLDIAMSSLHRSMGTYLEQKQRVMDRLHLRLYAQRAGIDGTAARDELSRLQQRLSQAMIENVKVRRVNRNHLLKRLDDLSPLKVMQRGYALISDEEGTPLRSVNQVKLQEKVIVRMIDGTIMASVIAKGEDSSE